MKHEINLRLEKETKNTVKYEEVGDGPLVIGGLYIQKWAAKERPNTIKVTIEAEGLIPE